ncbi:MAG: GMC oxidoreductase [Gammaproteobacteria bacterium]
MIEYLDAIGDQAELETDVCIVGAGPAGIALANEFRDSGTRVLLLESGDLNFEPDTQDLYRGQINNLIPANRLDVSRLRFFGGTSNHWEGSCGPLDAIDFKERDGMPLSGWPIEKQDLHAYYQRSSDFIGLKDEKFEPAQWADATRPLIEFADDRFTTSMRCRKPIFFGPAYEETLTNSANIKLVLHANLTEIQRSGDGRRVESVTIRSLQGKSASVKASQYILACGGVENARILLANDFDQELDFVGRCFFFHARPTTAMFLLSDQARLEQFDLYSDWQIVNDQKLRFAIRLNEKEQARLGIGNHAIMLRPTPAPPYPMELKRIVDRLRGEISLDGFMDDLYGTIQQMDAIADRVEHELFPDEEPLPVLATRISMDQTPNRNSRVTLNDETDALDMRRVTLNWAHTDEEISALKKMHELLGQSLGASGLGRLQLLDTLDNSDALHREIQMGGGGGHQMGTTRMSTTPATGVVDRNCQVHGVDNFYCAGSSVFPTGGWMNPTMTIIALAIRLADHLKTA